MENYVQLAIIVTLFIISVLFLFRGLKIKQLNEIQKLSIEQKQLKLSVSEEELEKNSNKLNIAQTELNNEKKLFEDYRKNKEDEYFQKLDKLRLDQLEADQELAMEKQYLKDAQESVRLAKRELEIEQKEYSEKLELELLKVNNLTKEEAKELLFANLKEFYQNEYLKEIKRYKEHLELDKQQLAREIVIQSVENISLPCSNDAVYKPIKIPNDDIKGKLIGREGRNIRLMENLLGVNVIIDDTPNMIGISCFNSTRRYIASEVIEKLVSTGKINQTIIEETVAKSIEETDDFMIEKGKEAIYEFNITDMNIELVKLIGQLYFRASYGQNVYMHTIETAKMAYKMAGLFNVDPILAARCALLHDIGKVDAIESGETHVALGVAYAKEYDESEIVINAIQAHHDEVEPESFYATILQICDRISAGREGIRKESYEHYIKRVTSLENIALEEEGVIRAFALQGARELRIIVESRKIKDQDMALLAQNIKEKIATRLTFPGKVQINVIREVRYKTDVMMQNGDYE